MDVNGHSWLAVHSCRTLAIGMCAVSLQPAGHRLAAAEFPNPFSAMLISELAESTGGTPITTPESHA
jgi:hypothetical protein